MQSPRLPALSAETFTPEQRALAESIKSGPRGQFKMAGPFAVYLHAPGFGELAQQLGGHLRFKTSVPPRLSEFAILVTAQHWKAQYEWAMHAVIAEKQGVKRETIRDLQAGRAPKSAPRDEMAIYAFVKELYAKRRVEQRQIQARAKTSRRCRHRRAGRHSRLLRHGGDDARRLPHAVARGHAGAVPRAGGPVATERTRSRRRGRRACCLLRRAPWPRPARGLFMRWRNSSRKRSLGIGGAMSTPWPKSQPITIKACRSAWVSTPSATAALPKRWARSIAVWQIAALVGVGGAAHDESSGRP